MNRDPLMLTDVRANRVPLDAYWTERAATVAFHRTIQQLAPRGVPPLPHRIWEPSCGANWIAAELEGLGYEVYASDIADYRGTVDYRRLKQGPVLRNFLADREFEPWGEQPYAIVGNSPFDDLAEEFVRMALAKPNAAVVWFLLKNEYDLSNTARPDLFRRPDYAMKICLTWRPLWATPAGPIVSERSGKAEGARQTYAWYGWFRHARARWPGARIVYADRPVLEAERAARAPQPDPRRFRKSTPPANAWWTKEDGK